MKCEIRKKRLYVYIVYLIFLGISSAYVDFYATQRHGIEVWNCIKSGNLFSFYSYVENIPFGPHFINKSCAAIYDFPLYLVFAIWNFPSWLYELFTGKNAQDVWVLVAWGKMMMLSFSLLCAIYIKKIWQHINKVEDIDLNGYDVMLFFLTSVILVYYSVICGNYDVVSACFTIIGVYFYLQNDNKKWLLFFAIGIAMKYWALLCFVPLVLYRYKNIIKIIFNIITGLSITIVSKGLFILFGGHTTGIGLKYMLDDLVGQKFSVGISGNTSILLLLYCALCAYCYLHIEEDNNYDFVIKVCFWTYLVFFVFDDAMPYWTVILMPFLTLYVLSDKSNMKYNLLWSFFFEFFLLCYLQMRFCWVPNGGVYINMLPYKVLDFFHLLKNPSFVGHSWGEVFLKIQTVFDVKTILGTLTTGSALMLAIGKSKMLINSKINVDFIHTKKWITWRERMFALEGVLPMLLWCVQAVLK